jgi:hypothetical protein
LSNSEYLQLFEDYEIMSSVMKSDFLVEILADKIRKSISSMDKEEQILFSDIYNDDKVCQAHNDIYGAMDTLALLLDNGYKADVVGAIIEDKGDW